MSMKRPDWLSLDNALIALVFAVTVPRSASVIAAYEAPDLWWVAWLAAVAFDLAIMRLAYVWQLARRRARRTWTLAGFAIFAGFSWAWQAMYLWERTDMARAVLLSVAWPLLIVFLAVQKGMADDTERRHADTPATALTVTETHRHSVKVIGTPERKAKVLTLAQGGTPIADIVAQTGTPKRTVYRWLAGRHDA